MAAQANNNVEINVPVVRVTIGELVEAVFEACGNDGLTELIRVAQSQYSFDYVVSGSLSFAYFAACNRARCESPDGFNHDLDWWSLSDWFAAVTGELGEAANIVKKLNRIRDGITPGLQASEHALRSDFRDEIADVFIYLDLIAQSQGFSLEEAVRQKFNATSDKIGYRVKLGSDADEPKVVASPKPTATDILIADLYDLVKHHVYLGDDRHNAAARAKAHVEAVFARTSQAGEKTT